MNGYLTHDLVTFGWVDKGVADGQAPTTDHIVELKDCDGFVIQIDTTAAGHTAASIDIGVLYCLNVDAATPVWDTAVTNLAAAFGDNLKQCIHVDAIHGGWAKLRLDVNDNVGNVTVRLRKRTRRS